MEENNNQGNKSQNTQDPSKKKEEQGALWVRKSKQGNSFLSGSIKTESGEELKVVVFKNSYKQEGSNQPDYRVYLDESTPVDANKATTKASTPNLPEVAENDDIPF